MASTADKLEDRTAEILGQIQASVAEYVRTMNEAGALRRREADEAHRQQDEAVRALKAIQVQSAATVDAHAKLAARVGGDWLGLVERGLREVAEVQGQAAAKTAVSQIDIQLAELTAVVRDAVRTVGQLADRNEKICRALAWRTIVVSAGWLILSAIGFRILAL